MGDFNPTENFASFSTIPSFLVTSTVAQEEGLSDDSFSMGSTCSSSSSPSSLPRSPSPAVSAPSSSPSSHPLKYPWSVAGAAVAAATGAANAVAASWRQGTPPVSTSAGHRPAAFPGRSPHGPSSYDSCINVRRDSSALADPTAQAVPGQDAAFSPRPPPPPPKPSGRRAAAARLAATYDVGGADYAPSASLDFPSRVEAGQGQAGLGSAYDGQAPGWASKELPRGRRRGQPPPRKHWTDALPAVLDPRKYTRRQAAVCLIMTTLALIVMIVVLSMAARRTIEVEGLLPGGDQGAAVTGVYRNLFTELMAKTPAESDAKVQEAYAHLFHGDPETEALYVEVEPNMAQIINTESDMVTSEGISYGMITCVHMDEQEPFNRLWNWARFHMQHTAGTFASFFAWRVTKGGLLVDAKDVIPAPDAEAYIAMALITAHRKWGSTPAYPYKAEALRLLRAMGQWQRGFFSRDGKATFNPTDWGSTHSNPSYHLPHFYEAFARFMANEGESRASGFWSGAARKSRFYFHVASNKKTGLMPDYTTLDGKPAPDPNLGGHTNFQWDAWRAPANVAVDWAWWNADGWQPKFADRILAFFASQGPEYASQYTTDGQVADNNTGHDPGLVAMNAVVVLAARDQALKPSFVRELWELPIPSGKGRYYPAMLYVMSLLHCSGKFKAYF